MTAKRQKKPDPERMEPNRNGTFYRSKGWGSPKSNGHQKPRGGRFGSSVMDALGACQKLLDEQVRRGSARTEGLNSPFGNLGDQAERMIRTMSDAVIDMSSMWFDYLGSLWRAEEQGEDDGTHAHNGDESVAAVDVVPADRAHAALDLKHGARLDTLKLQPLLDADGNRARISADVARGPNGMWVRIVVDDEQAAGRFHALALDPQTGAIGGTLSVTVKDAQ